MGYLKETKATKQFQLSIDDLKKLVIADLGYTPSEIFIEEIKKVVSSDPMDRFDTVYGFDGLKITIVE